MRPNYFIFIGYLKTWGGIRADPHNPPSGSVNVLLPFSFSTFTNYLDCGQENLSSQVWEQKNVADQPVYSCSLISGFVIKSTRATSNILLF